MVGMDVPLLPLAHQYVEDRPGRRARRAQRRDCSEAGLPILRHQDHDLYYREHGDRLGIGSYAHRPMPVRAGATCPRARSPTPRCPRCCRSPRRTSRRPGSRASGCCPRCAAPRSTTRLQRDLLLHPRRRPADRRVRGRRGLLDRRGGLGDPLRRRRQGGGRSCWSTAAREIDLHGCDVHRFEEVQLAAGLRRGDLAAELRRDLRHPAPVAAQESPRNLRVSPFHARQRELGAVFLEGARLGAAALVRGQRRTGRASCRRNGSRRPGTPGRAKFHSPIAAAEAWKTRHRGGDVRHDPAQAARGQRARRARPAAAADHRQDGQDPSARSPTP